MRILPVGLFFADLPDDELLDYVHRTSSLTHRHPRSQMACGFYCLMAAKLLKGLSIEDSYTQAIASSSQHYHTHCSHRKSPTSSGSSPGQSGTSRKMKLHRAGMSSTPSKQASGVFLIQTHFKMLSSRQSTSARIRIPQDVLPVALPEYIMDSRRFPKTG